MATTSIVIPCRDEAPALPRLSGLLESWEELGERELLFVDDGSRDDTARLIRELFPAARLLVHPEGRGLGAALRTGTQAARGDLVAWFDADATYHPACLPRLRERLLATGADVATVSPWMPGGGIEGVPWIRLLPSRGASFLYRLLGPARLHTWTAMVRVHRQELLCRCLPVRDGYPGVTESLLRILLQGGKVVEMPAVLQTRLAGTSKMKALRAVKGHLGLLAALMAGRLGTPGGRND